MEGADNISFNGLMKETDGLWRQLAVSELSMHPAIGEIADRVRKPVVRVSPRNEHETNTVRSTAAYRPLRTDGVVAIAMDAGMMRSQ